MGREDPAFRVEDPGTEYTIDPATLRGTAVHPAAMIAAAESLVARATTSSDPRDPVADVSKAALMFAMAGQLARAGELLPALSNLDPDVDPRHRVAAQLRLVQLLQALGRLAEAVAVAQQALTASRASPSARPLEHLALHHLGKALLDAGDASGARQALARALQLREGLGDAALVQSTRLALSVADRRATR